MTYKILDLFAGVSGLSLGLELFRDNNNKQLFEVFRSVEIDHFACETLRNLHGQDKVIEGDLTKKEIHKQVIDQCKGNVSIVVGGIPCQSFSLIGARSGDDKKKQKFKDDKRDNLFQEYLKIVKEIKPKIIVIENVKGILSKKNNDGTLIIHQIISDFEELGFNFIHKKTGAKYRLVDAANFGVPQKRERVILIGVKTDWKNVEIPFIERTHANPLDNTKLLPYVTLFDAIGDLPEVESSMTKTGLNKKEIISAEKRNKKINSGNDNLILNKDLFKNHFSELNKSGKQFVRFIHSKNNKMFHHVARNHQRSDIELFRKMKQGETAKDFLKRCSKKDKLLVKYKMNSFMDKYRRQSYKFSGTTIFAHLQKDGNRFIHPTQARSITVREAARIQSFPDWFEFKGPITQKYKQIGNAVPPLLSKNYIANVLYKIIRY